MIGSFGGEVYDFEAVQWVRLFRGEYATAKEIMARLDVEGIPNRLTFPDTNWKPSTVVIEVMRRWLSQARNVIEADSPAPKST